MKQNKLTIGILAHVDAGKTTLAESILYLSGTIRTLGRVDHQNAYLDTYELEKQRGITIFSKQAVFNLGEMQVTLLDTPGHVDFSAEMERTLQVLDYAVLVINGKDGVKGNVATLWRLLERYRIPVFIFINKMDQEGSDQAGLMEELRAKLAEECVLFGDQPSQEFYEELAMIDENIMESYLAEGSISQTVITGLIGRRKLFPCYFGSALKMDGVEAFLKGLERYTASPQYAGEFAAKVYKISRDAQGTRLTHLKITGGCLKVKSLLSGISKGEPWEEKADQIRIYSGGQYQSAAEVSAGTICAVTGLNHTYAGEGLGLTQGEKKPVLEPVLSYRLQLPEGCDTHGMYRNLCQLQEEEPQLKVVWDDQSGEMQVRVMGEVQIEILKSMMKERFDIDVEFGTGSIVYKESIAQPVQGAGHFEPLRHYAEVHVLLEPTPPGSGLSFASICSEDILDKNWQRLILTHFAECKHPGVLTGADITDMKITLTAGRAHQKHTEGGDFREATYRAIRQGLMKAESILLEPVYDFRLEIPSDKVGRALSDIQKMAGSFEPAEISGDMATLTGRVPVIKIQDYQIEVVAYTRGEGRLFLSPGGYGPCHNAEEVIAAKGYEPERDLTHSPDSVFCSHGTGVTVPWQEADVHMHVKPMAAPGTAIPQEEEQKKTVKTKAVSETAAGDKELEEIFVRTYGPVNRDRMLEARRKPQAPKPEKEWVYKPKEPLEEYLLVDGYNIIFAWEELKTLAKTDLMAARDRLCEILCNYQGYKQVTVILVFDAYKVRESRGETERYQNIYIVYTKHAETADQYIERTVQKMKQKYHVTVATSDALEQIIIWGMGAMRMSANGLQQEIEAMNQEIRAEYLTDS